MIGFSRYSFIWIGVATQRSYCKLYQEGKPNKMTEERFRALKNIGFEHVYVSRKASLASIWSERFQQMCAFKVQFGHFVVPAQYSANPKLGRWVSTQRYHCKLYQEGKPSPMTAKRIRELESVEFKWERNYVSWSE